MRFLAVFVPLLLLACEPEPEPGTFEPVTGHCTYINGFSDGQECKEYMGDGWTLEAILDDCEEPIVRAEPGTFTEGLPCETGTHIGICWLDSDSSTPSRIVFPEDEADACSGAKLGCDFAQGEFEAGETCADMD